MAKFTWLAMLCTAPYVAFSSDVNCRSEDVEISADGASYFVPSRCTSLFVDGDAEGLEKFISAIDFHPSLTSLSFARDPRRARFDGGVSASEVATLLKVLPNTNIHHLSLAFNRVGDFGLSLISAGLKNTKLESIDLENTDINDEGASALASTLKEDDTELSSVNLSNNNIGGVASELLEAVKRHSKISQIGDEGTAIGRSENFHGQALRSLLQGECVPSPWSEWTSCSGKCGAQSSHSRSRQIVHLPHARHNVKKCPHTLEEERSCIVECGDEPPTLETLTVAEDTNAKSFRLSALKAEAEKQAAEKEAAEKEAAEKEAAEKEAAEKEAAEKEAAEKEAAEKEAAEKEAAAQEPVGGEAEVEQSENGQTADDHDESSGSTLASETVESPVAEESTPDYRTRLESFYAKYNPGKAKGVDDMLARYEGREEVLFNSLVAKYGPEP